MHHEAAAVLQVCLLVALDAWSYPPSEVYHVASEVVDSTRWTTAAGAKRDLDLHRYSVPRQGRFLYDKSLVKLVGYQ